MTHARSTTPRFLFTGHGTAILRHVPSFAKLFWRLFRDRRVSLLPKALLVLVAIYLLSPLDVVPELVPVVGAMDDLVVGAAGLWFFVRLCPPPVVREHVAAIAAAAEARG